MVGIIKSLLMLLGLITLSCILIGCATEVSMSGFGMILNPIVSSVSPSEFMKFKIDLVDYGLSKIKSSDVQLEHFLIQKETGEILKRTIETVRMKGPTSLDRGLEVPSDALPGDYQIRTIAKRKNRFSENSFDFQVTDENRKISFDSLDLSEQEIYEPIYESDVLDLREEIVEVIIQGYTAIPEQITVQKGTKVRWTNKDNISHTITGAGFDSGPIRDGYSFMHEFNESGLRYIYKSTIHNRVLGSVTVKGGN